MPRIAITAKQVILISSNPQISVNRGPWSYLRLVKASKME